MTAQRTFKMENSDKNADKANRIIQSLEEKQEKIIILIIFLLIIAPFLLFLSLLPINWLISVYRTYSSIITAVKESKEPISDKLVSNIVDERFIPITNTLWDIPKELPNYKPPRSIFDLSIPPLRHYKISYNNAARDSNWQQYRVQTRHNTHISRMNRATYRRYNL